MLKDSLYTIQTISNEHNVVSADIELNTLHEIFKGHFPNQPVLPGVCILQITREIVEVAIGKKLQLRKADDIRFSAMVDPDKNKILHFKIQCKTADTNSININAKILKQDEIVCCKVKASLEISATI